MGLRLLASSLRSRRIRKALAPNGVRKINAKTLARGGKSDVGLIGKGIAFFEKIKGIVGGAFDKLKSNPRNIGQLLRGIFVGGVQKLLFFDWNKSSEQIQGQIKANNESLFERWGEVVGYVFCVGTATGVTAMVPKIGPIVAQLALPNVLEEVKDQLIDAVKDSMRVASQNIGMTLYMHIRSFLKNDEIVRKIAKSIPGIGDNLDYFLEHWGSGKEPWTIYGSIEKQIDKIPIESLKAFAQGALEGCLEGYFNAVAILTMNFEDYLISQQQMRAGMMGSQRALDIKIDPESDRPPIRLSGPQQVLLPTAQLLIQQEHLMRNREVGESYNDDPAPSGKLEPLERWLIIYFERNPKPPWNRAGKARRSWRYKIPNPKSGLTHDKLRRLTGANKTIKFGGWEASAKLPSGRPIYCRGGSKKEAEDRLADLIKLSEEDEWSLTPGHEIAKHKKSKDSTGWAPIETIQCYPRAAKLIVKKYLSVSSSSAKDVRKERSTGRLYREQAEILEIWRESLPEGEDKFTIY